MKAAGTLMILGLVSTVGLSAQSARKPTSQPDIFLITIDTLRADHLGCYGYKSIQTPAVDSLAKDGIRFAQAFTPSPIKAIPARMERNISCLHCSVILAS